LSALKTPRPAALKARGSLTTQTAAARGISRDQSVGDV
jgi:hypothetical protein